MAIRSLIFFSALLLITQKVFARNDYWNWEEGDEIFMKAQIIVLEAPIFLEKNLKSNVIMTARKGQIIRIHPNALRIKGDFYHLIDKVGRIAYIPKSFVKILHHDAKELSENDNLKFDPTDYRIEEPLPRNYPFYEKDHKTRAHLFLGLGSQIKNNYNYKTPVSSEDYGRRLEGVFTYLKSPEFDKEKKFFVGLSLFFNRAHNEFLLTDKTLAKETWFRAGAGPYATYQLLRLTQKWTFNLHFGVYYNFINHNNLDLAGPDGSEELRSFSGFAFTGHGGLYLNYLPSVDRDFSFSFGFHSHYDFLSKLTSQNAIGSNSAWQSDKENDFIENSSNIEPSLFLGIQINT